MKTNKELLKSLNKEYAELKEKLDKALDFSDGHDFDTLPDEHRCLLLRQIKEMNDYLMTLADRMRYIKNTMMEDN